jgi:hypothetical protein
VEKRLTVDEAYRAMFAFLDEYYARTRSDEVGGLLGSMAINTSDGQPMDLGMWEDWVAAVALTLGRPLGE